MYPHSVLARVPIVRLGLQIGQRLERGLNPLERFDHAEHPHVQIGRQLEQFARLSTLSVMYHVYRQGVQLQQIRADRRWLEVIAVREVAAHLVQRIHGIQELVRVEAFDETFPVLLIHTAV
jgi:hypothetical protein